MRRHDGSRGLPDVVAVGSRGEWETDLLPGAELEHLQGTLPCSWSASGPCTLGGWALTIFWPHGSVYSSE